MGTGTKRSPPTGRFVRIGSRCSPINWRSRRKRRRIVTICAAGCLQEYGVTYNLPGGSEPEQRPWQLDSWPLLISADEWNSLSRGVAQRAQLLNLILADIYGPRRLLESGDLPPEIVLANPAFLRAATHVVPPQNNYLTLYAVDVARSPNGRWWVVGDRSDTPVGMGYALENRIVLSRVYPDLIRDLLVTRLAKFFAGLRDRLLALAAARGDEPRIVILTPGPFHPTHFEQVYLARYLGFSLVEGEDLTVRDRGVFLKTLSGLLPVDVILRCVRSDFCDPLELRDDSLLGVAGLLQAARAGKVVLANAIGAGVVETPALLPFLPGLCRRLLGEELLLPPVATWWCGQPEALETVLAGLDRLVIKHAFPARETAAFMPVKHAPDAVRATILANPHLYVGQEYVSLSTAPTWQNQQLQPRHLMLRLYAAAAGNGQYVVMPGALARAGNSPESILMSSETGGGSKDTWVLGDSPPDTTTLLPTGGRSSALSRAGFILPSRLADNLFWLGRYMERIEFGCRLARCVLHRLTDEAQQGQLGGLAFLLAALTEHGRIQCGDGEADEREDSEASAELLENAVRMAVFDLENPRSIAADVSRVERISTAVRDRLSHDAWRIVRALADSFPGTLDSPDVRCEDQLAVARRSALAAPLVQRPDHGRHDPRQRLAVSRRGAATGACGRYVRRHRPCDGRTRRRRGGSLAGAAGNCQQRDDLSFAIRLWSRSGAGPRLAAGRREQSAIGGVPAFGPVSAHAVAAR